MNAPLRILLAEDHADNRAMLTLRLERRGFAVTGVENGQEAVSAALAERFDVILMDLSMPVLSGLEAVKIIRAAPAGASANIIALTAHAMESTRAECLAAGCNAFATKPIDFPGLLASIGALARAAQER